MNKPTYSIMIIDDHPIVLDGLTTLLANEEDLSVDATASTAAEALEALETVTPDLAIIDLSLDDSDGSYLIQRIHHLYPKIIILVYSMSEEKLFSERVAGAGASGYVMKTSSSATIKEAIRTLLNGDLFFSPDIKQRVQNNEISRIPQPKSSLENLSNREMDIFTLVGQGMNTLQISKKLDISRNTVDTHRINIRNKLDLPNGKALDRYAYEVVVRGDPPQD